MQCCLVFGKPCNAVRHAVCHAVGDAGAYLRPQECSSVPGLGGNCGELTDFSLVIRLGLGLEEVFVFDSKSEG